MDEFCRWLQQDRKQPPQWETLERDDFRAYLRYLSIVGSLVGLAMHGDADTYRYIPETLKLYPGQRGICQMMQEAGFVDTGFREFGGGIMAINYGTRPSQLVQ